MRCRMVLPDSPATSQHDLALAQLHTNTARLSRSKLAHVQPTCVFLLLCFPALHRWRQLSLSSFLSGAQTCSQTEGDDFAAPGTSRIWGKTHVGAGVGDISKHIPKDSYLTTNYHGLHTSAEEQPDCHTDPNSPQTKGSSRPKENVSEWATD